MLLRSRGTFVKGRREVWVENLMVGGWRFSTSSSLIYSLESRLSFREGRVTFDAVYHVDEWQGREDVENPSS